MLPTSRAALIAGHFGGPVAIPTTFSSLVGSGIGRMIARKADPVYRTVQNELIRDSTPEQTVARLSNKDLLKLLFSKKVKGDLAASRGRKLLHAAPIMGGALGLGAGVAGTAMFAPALVPAALGFGGLVGGVKALMNAADMYDAHQFMNALQAQAKFEALNRLAGAGISAAPLAGGAVVAKKLIDRHRRRLKEKREGAETSKTASPLGLILAPFFTGVASSAAGSIGTASRYIGKGPLKEVGRVLTHHPQGPYQVRSFADAKQLARILPTKNIKELLKDENLARYATNPSLKDKVMDKAWWLLPLIPAGITTAMATTIAPGLHLVNDLPHDYKALLAAGGAGGLLGIAAAKFLSDADRKIAKGLPKALRRELLRRRAMTAAKVLGGAGLASAATLALGKTEDKE